MKIYFAGSIRGGREDIAVYSQIINYLKKSHEVLTEHVGCEEIRRATEDNITETEIYERDCNWLKVCDCIVAEVTTPSLGVGYEIAYGEKLGKNIICLFNENGKKQLSAMISGNKNLTVLRYKNLADLKYLDNLLNNFENK